MKITDVIISFQAWCRGYVARKYARPTCACAPAPEGESDV